MRPAAATAAATASRLASRLSPSSSSSGSPSSPSSFAPSWIAGDLDGDDPATWLVAAASAADVSVMARHSAGWSQIFFRMLIAERAEPVLLSADRTVLDLRKAR